MPYQVNPPPVVIDLRLCQWAELEKTPKLIEEEHNKLHKGNTLHIHLDGSLGN